MLECNTGWRRGHNLFESAVQVIPSVQYSYAQTAAQRFDALFGGKRVFDNPKPFEDLATLVNYLCGPDDLVMDFFAGSGSTGHGVWLANQKFGTQRRFILVQLDVSVNTDVVSGKNASELGLGTIDAITIERLRRVSAQFNSEGVKGDLGFRVFREAPPQFAHSANLRSAEQQALDFASRRAPLTAAELLAEVLLLLGYPLDAEGTQVPELLPNIVWRFNHPRVGSPLLLCLDDNIDDETAEKLQDFKGQTFACRDEALRDQVKLRIVDAELTIKSL